jgi:hypothetical protein
MIANQVPRASIRTTLTYRAAPTLSLGLEYNPRAEDLGLIANWVAMTETGRRPAMIIGTSSDRIGTPSGRSYYVTGSKSIEDLTRLPVAPYVGVAYGEYEDRFRAIGGANIALSSWLTGMVIFDGVRVHPILSVRNRQYIATFIMARGKDPGVSYSISF